MALRFLQRVANRLDQIRHAFRQQIQLVGSQAYDLLLISDGQGWILDDFSRSIVDHLEGTWKASVISGVPTAIKGRVLHFVERYGFFRISDPEALTASNRTSVTWWHGGANPSEQQHLDELLSKVSRSGKLPLTFHITSSLYRDVLVERGIAPERIVHIPMGVDLRRFAMKKPGRAAYKRYLQIPQERVCIGYFQRDGDAEQPKLVKGPDVFIETLERLWSKRDDLFVLLAGPRRGYVMRELDRLGVPYRQCGWVPFTEMAPYYFASDLYLITSREEGGPAAVIECMATGTPLVSTRVGMAVDVIRHGKNGFLVEVEDSDGLADHALRLIEDLELRTTVSQEALATAPAYDWTVIGPRYEQALYASNSKQTLRKS